jgi:hypothetical protein
MKETSILSHIFIFKFNPTWSHNTFIQYIVSSYMHIKLVYSLLFLFIYHHWKHFIWDHVLFLCVEWQHAWFMCPKWKHASLRTKLVNSYFRIYWLLIQGPWTWFTILERNSYDCGNGNNWTKQNTELQKGSESLLLQ